MEEIDSEQFEELSRLLADPQANISGEVRAQAQEAVDGFKAKYLKGWGEGRAPDPRDQAPPVPGELGLVRVLGQDPPERDPAEQLDPSLPLMPQALAVQPATTDPDGDEAAASKWLVSGGKDAKGTVFVYEPPLREARKELLENPAILAVLGYDELPPTPEQILALTSDNEIYRSYADYKWRQAAEAAAASGHTAYRHSRAPWLQSGGAMSAIQTLGMKALGNAKPAVEGINSFVLGVDDTASFGLARAAQETVNPTIEQPKEGAAGGIPTADAQHYNAMTQEEHPWAYTGGQALGMLAPWGPANRLYDYVASGGVKVASKLGGGLAARLGASAAAGTVAGGATQAAQEGVDAAASLAQTGETGTTLGEAAERVRDVGLTSGGLGTLLEGVGSFSKGTADEIADGPRYDGAPGRLERANVRFSSNPLPSKGGPIISRELQGSIDTARNVHDLKSGSPDVIAKEIAPKIEGALDEHVKENIAKVTDRKQKFFATREGEQLLPVPNLIDKAVDILRRKHQPTEAGLEAIRIRPNERVTGILNDQIAGVSVKPTEGAIAISAEEAGEFLAPSWQKKLTAKPGKAESGGAREFDEGDFEPGSSEPGGFAAGLRARGVEQVYLVPRRYDAKRQQELINEINDLRSSDSDKHIHRELGELDEAARKDRDLRPMDGKAGGWSKLQAEHEQWIGESKKTERLGAPGGEAFNTLAGHGTQRTGELLTAEALRKAADKGGVREQLDQIRILDPLLQLRNDANFGRYNKVGQARGGFNSAADYAALRAFPWLRALGAPTAPIRGGTGGKGALFEERENEKRRREELLK